MGYLPQFKNDIFISYRHASDEARNKWVYKLRDELDLRLADLVGKIDIWRDKEELLAGDQWRQRIAEALDNTAIFLAIVSGSYFESEECRKELDQFLGQVKDATETLQRRIVPIFKQPPPPDVDLPQELAEIHRHEFFQYDPKGSHLFREFSPSEGDHIANEFDVALARLAQDLALNLRLLKGYARDRAVGTVFLSSAGPELRSEREQLRSDLQQRGYYVVPEHEYLWNSSGLREKISKDVAAADLCVHLVDQIASNEPKTPERARLQLELATEAMKGKSKSLPLVWIQPSNQIDASARALIDYVEQELSNDGVEYWQGSLEDFKTQIYDKLPRPPAKTSTASLREIALIMEEGDIAAVEEVNDFIADVLNLEPKRIKFTGTTAKNAATCEKTLASCGRCIIYWGAQSEIWVDQLLALDALAGFIGKERLCVYAAPPATPEKNSFNTSKARIILAAQTGNEAELRDFLETAKGVQ